MKLLKFFEFLNESTNKDEIIDFATTDLYENFNFLNKLLFDNKVKPVPLKWFKSKTKVGIMVHTGYEIEYVGISTFYKMTKKQFLETLAHEMIHVYMLQQKINDNGDHGREFQKILNSINQKHPEYNIKPTENADFFSVNSTKKKLTGVLLFIADGNDYTAIFTNNEIVNDESIINKFIDDLKKYIQRVPLNIFVRNKTIDIKIYSSDSPELLTFKIKRQLSLNNLGFYNVTEKILKEIEAGELISTIKLK